MLYSGSAKNNDYGLTIKNYSGLKNLMKSGKPGLVVAALIYFSIISALAAAATFYLLIFGDDLRLFSVLSIMALLPNLIGVIVLMKEPSRITSYNVCYTKLLRCPVLQDQFFHGLW